ncbi:MAG TPA: hypothetical protein VGF54_18310, partial [Streptosporangiaceae bacterium]
LPRVLVLSPEEAAEAAGWPEFSPPVITAEARRRGEMYAERQRRQEAGRAFGGTREEFLAWAGTQVTIAAATAADVPRLAELAARTRQFNSAAGRDVGAPGEGMTEGWFRGLLAAPDRDVVTVRLRDAFGDDGLVGGCVITREAGTWAVPLLMMSCRAMGRGVIDALLVWLTRHAARAGAGRLRIPCVPGGRNVPLRLALAAAGFRAPGRLPAVYQRDLGTPRPALPGWVTAPGEPGGDAA